MGKGSDYRFGVGPEVVGSVGYGLGNGLRFELQGVGVDNKINHFKTGGALPGAQAGGDEYKLGVFANALFDIPINAPVVPYVGGGIGYLHNQFNNAHVYGTQQFLRSTGQNRQRRLPGHRRSIVPRLQPAPWTVLHG